MNLHASVRTAPFCIALTVLAACVVGPSSTAPDGYQSVQFSDFAYSVPSAWTEASTTSVIRSAYQSPADASGRVTTVRVTVEPYSGDGTAYTQASASAFQVNGYTLVNQQAATVGNLPAGTLEVHSPAGTRALVRLTAYNGYGYALTCQTDESAFAAVRATCSTVLDSFSVGIP